ncbi:MAG TPA: DUF3040 domain-containing protein [Kineosporiaceae bacterium]|nr:DUF3040 domain-containing protein [Kineosporiaceae bacterium]
MRQPLTRRERSALRRLAEQIREEDPQLAEQLERPAVQGMGRFSPVCWPVSAYLVIGIAFLATGLLLDVGSATAGGLLSLVVATVRSRSVRRMSLRALAVCEAGFNRPLG